MRPKLQLAGVLLTALVLAAAGTAKTGLAAGTESKSSAAKTESKSSTSKTTETRRPWLGVVTQSLDDDLRDGLDYRGDGVLVNRVADDSPAAKAGVKQGDVIVSLNSKSVNSPEDLQDLVRSAKAGDRAAMVVVRDGKKQTLTASLVERPTDMSWGDDQHRIVIREAPGMQFDLDHMPDMPDLPDMMPMGRSQLGVELQDLNADLGGYFSVPDGKGALIVSVVEGSAAEKAGLKSGDVIVKIGDQVVEDADDAARAIRRSEGTTSIEVMRKGKRTSLSAALEKRDRGERSVHRIEMGDLPDMMWVGEHRVDSELRREMQELRRQIRELSEQLKQKSQN